MLPVAAFILLAILCATSLLTCITRLVRTLRSAVELDVELREHVELTLSAAGPKILHVRAPRFTNVRALSFSLRAPDQQSIPLHRSLVRMVQSGFQDVRMSVASCDIPTPGTYTLSTAGIPQTERPMALVVTRPHALAMAGWIVGIVLSAGATIASIVTAVLLHDLH